MDEAVTMRATLGPHLPYLRRYARALTGTQRSGDAFVRAALEALLVTPDSLPEASSPKLALFKLFHLVSGPHSEGYASAGREGLLLTAIEGFSVSEAAEILGQPAEETVRNIESARAAIASSIRSRVLIIEDEPVISLHLEQIVQDMGHEVAATAMTRDEAVAEAKRVLPDLVLADIQLADGSSGLDAARDILDLFDVPVIFITAYPERLLTGERPEPTFLVTKPFDPETVIATVGQALIGRQETLAPAA
jgi:CheY-like chemotaxis protein